MANITYIFIDNTHFAHKTGVLDYMNHDVGLMDINNQMIYIGISVYNCKKKEGNKQIVEKIGNLIYNTYK